MANYYLEDTWKGKSDDELLAAGNDLQSYSAEIHPIIRNEIQRRGLSVPPEAARAQGKQEVITKVQIVDLDMPFGSMVLFIIKWSLAAIPALIILLIIGGIAGTLFAGVIASIFHR